MKSKSAVDGYKRGLRDISAKPATITHTQFAAAIERMSDDHGSKLSAGGNEDRLREIAGEKLKLHRAKIRDLNQQIARDAADSLRKISEDIQRRYEASPTARLADIADAQMKFSILDKGEIKAMADSFLSGEKLPRSQYELFELIKHVPKHDLAQRWKETEDFAFFTVEGREAHRTMTTYASMGDRIPHVTSDGDLIGVDVDDLYSPPQISAQEIAQREMSG